MTITTTSIIIITTTGPHLRCCHFNVFFFLLLFQHLNKTFNADVPLVLMNSFNTDEDTKKILQKYKHHQVKIHSFNQSR